VFSDLPDLDGPIDGRRCPRLVGAGLAEIVLEPGEIIFMPATWRHQVRSLEFSVTLTYTNFRWPNDASATSRSAEAQQNDGGDRSPRRLFHVART
jgi:hypothetical protein